MQASGVIPQISLVMGPSAGGAVYSPAMTDFVLMVEESSYMFITGPEVVKTVTGEDVTSRSSAARPRTRRSPASPTSRADDEDACLEDARYLLSFLPQNNVDPPPCFEPSDPIGREDAELDTIIPDEPTKPYDMRDVIERVVDDGELLEVHERWAENIVCAFARLGGHPVGVVANNRARWPAPSTSTPRVKAARFVRFCDAFNIPLVTFVDVPGFLPGTAQEWGGIIRHGAKLLYAYCEATVPEDRRDHAQGVRRRVRRHELQAHPRGLQLRLADRRGGGHGPEGAVNIVFRKELEDAEDPDARARGADRGVQGAVREPVRRGRAGLRGRRDRAAADAAGADRRAEDGDHEARAPPAAEARKHPALELSATPSPEPNVEAAQARVARVGPEDVDASALRR